MCIFIFEGIFLGKCVWIGTGLVNKSYLYPILSSILSYLIQVEAKKEIVACDEALANEAAAAAQAIRDDCENDLAEAIPALQSAINALNTLKPSDITVVKSMKNPAPIVKFVIEAVCVMKGIQPKRKPDLENKGKLIDDYWSPGKVTLVLTLTV